LISLLRIAVVAPGTAGSVFAVGSQFVLNERVSPRLVPAPGAPVLVASMRK